MTTEQEQPIVPPETTDSVELKTGVKSGPDVILEG
jgi:hypothetical protein